MVTPWSVTPCPTPGDTACQFRTGPYIFLGQAIPLKLEQSVYALFGELNLPVTDALNAQLALRFEDYGGQTGSTLNPQFRLRYSATHKVVKNRLYRLSPDGDLLMTIDEFMALPTTKVTVSPVTASAARARGTT